jgi:hypothetical protein
VRRGYGASNTTPALCPLPTLAEKAVDVALPIVGFPAGVLAGCAFFPPLFVPVAGAVAGLYFLGKAWGRAHGAQKAKRSR